MDESVVGPAVKIALEGVRQRLEEAAGLAKAAEACALSECHDKGVEIASDVDALLKDAEGLLATATIANRFLERRCQQTIGTPANPPGAAEAPPPLEPRFLQAALKSFFSQARYRLDQALGIARAAEVVGEISDTAESVRVALGMEPLLYEARSFINTARIISRLPQA